MVATSCWVPEVAVTVTVEVVDVGVGVGVVIVVGTGGVPLVCEQPKTSPRPVPITASSSQ